MHRPFGSFPYLLPPIRVVLSLLRRYKSLRYIGVLERIDVNGTAIGMELYFLENDQRPVIEGHGVIIQHTRLFISLVCINPFNFLNRILGIVHLAKNIQNLLSQIMVYHNFSHVLFPIEAEIGNFDKGELR